MSDLCFHPVRLVVHLWSYNEFFLPFQTGKVLWSPFTLPPVLGNFHVCWEP